jgi:hypothetical protein
LRIQEIGNTCKYSVVKYNYSRGWWQRVSKRLRLSGMCVLMVKLTANETGSKSHPSNHWNMKCHTAVKARQSLPLKIFHQIFRPLLTHLTALQPPHSDQSTLHNAKKFNSFSEILRVFNP